MWKVSESGDDYIFESIENMSSSRRNLVHWNSSIYIHLPY